LPVEHERTGKVSGGEQEIVFELPTEVKLKLLVNNERIGAK